MSTRTLLTSLSPQATYALGNALAVSEQHADHAATLLCPPRVEIIRLRDEAWMQTEAQQQQQQQLQQSDSAVAHSVDAALAVVAPPAAAASSPPSSRWYALYSASDTLSFREMDAAREDYDSNCVYSTAFNVQPTCSAIRRAAAVAAAAPSAQSNVTKDDDDADAGLVSCEDLQCVSGFSNGALMVLNPFADKLRAAAGFNQPVADADSAEAGAAAEAEARALAAAAAAASGFSEASLTAIAALQDRTFNTAPTVLPMRVNCVCWIPALANTAASSLSSSQPSQQFIAGLADGRLLVFDLRVEEERRLDHPPFALASSAEAEISVAAALLSTSSKHKKESSKVSPASIAAAAAAAAAQSAAPRIHARQMFHVMQSPLQQRPATATTGRSAAVGSAASPPLHSSNPVMSWQIWTPPSPPSAASVSAASSAAAAAAATGAASSSAAAVPSSLLSALSSGINVDASAVSVLVVEFSVSGAFLAVSLSSGHILVLDWAARRLVVCFRTLYAPALTLAWTADERYLLSGGEEDLLCVWDCFVSRSLVLVGEGHANFITGIRMRPMMFNQPQGQWDATYRVVSVGQDKLLLFWEFQLPAPVEAESTPPSAATHEQTPSSSRAASAATTARRTASDDHSDRPGTASPTAAAAAATPFPAGTYSDLSAQLIPVPRRSAVRTMYPMAKNMAADRAVAWIAVGADSAQSRAQEQRRIWAQRAPPQVVARALGYASAEAASAECAASLASSAHASPACFVPPECDVLATICHGLRLRFWTRAAAAVVPEDEVDEDSADPQSPNARSSLGPRFARLHTPVLGRTEPFHEPVEASAAAAAAAAVSRRMSRGPQAPVVRK